MRYFVTSSRGFEEVIELELQNRLHATNIRLTDGKVYFDFDGPASDLKNLRSVERAFVLVRTVSPPVLPNPHGLKGSERDQAKARGLAQLVELVCGCTGSDVSIATHLLHDQPPQLEADRYATTTGMNDVEQESGGGHDEKNDPPNSLSSGSGSNVDFSHDRYDQDDMNWQKAIETWRSNRPPDASTTKIRFRVSCKSKGDNARGYTPHEIADAIAGPLAARYDWELDLKQNDLEIYVHLNDKTLLVGLPLFREVGTLANRAFMDNTGLRSTVGWCMAFLSQPFLQPGSLVLDPMVGVGTTLIEAALEFPLCRFVGGDVDRSQLSLCQNNLKHAKLTQQIGLVEWDSRRLSLADRSVGCVLLDLPFGRKFKFRSGDEKDTHEKVETKKEGCAGAAISSSLSTSSSVLSTSSSSSSILTSLPPFSSSTSFATASLSQQPSIPCFNASSSSSSSLLPAASISPPSSLSASSENSSSPSSSSLSSLSQSSSSPSELREKVVRKVGEQSLL